MPLTDAEKERVRYHLGYMGTSFGGDHAAASLSFGMPRPAQTMFLLESAIQTMLTNPYALERVRKLLCTLDDLEAKLEAAACQLGVESVGNVKMRGAEAGQTHPDLLEREYVRWAKRLADVLGVPLYAYSDRFNARTGVRNVTVR